jgi:hypothetical protein
MADEKHPHRDDAAAGEDPHHRLNVPADSVDEGGAATADQEDEGERLEAADDREEDVRTSEERSRKS